MATAAEQVIEPEEIIEPEQVDEAPKERDYEAEARAKGWVPEEEFKGKKRADDFIDAKEFVRSREYADKIVARVEKANEGRFAKLEKMSEKTITRLREQHAAQLKDLEASKDVAIEKGDVKAVRAIEKTITDHAAKAPDVEVPAAKTPDEVYGETVAAWEKDNPWYKADEDMATEADVISQRWAKANPDKSLADNLAHTTAKMREKYPLKLGGKTGANAHAPVDGGSLNGGRGKSSAFDRLSAVEKSQAQSDVAKGLYKNTDEWLKVYQS